MHPFVDLQRYYFFLCLNIIFCNLTPHFSSPTQTLPFYNRKASLRIVPATRSGPHPDHPISTPAAHHSSSPAKAAAPYHQRPASKHPTPLHHRTLTATSFAPPHHLFCKTSKNNRRTVEELACNKGRKNGLRTCRQGDRCRR